MLPGYMFRRMWVTRWGKVTLKKLWQESEYPGFSPVTGTSCSQLSEWSCQSRRLDLTPLCKHRHCLDNSRQQITFATASTWLSEAAIPERSPSRTKDGTDWPSELHTQGIEELKPSLLKTETVKYYSTLSQIKSSYALLPWVCFVLSILQKMLNWQFYLQGYWNKRHLFHLFQYLFVYFISCLLHTNGLQSMPSFFQLVPGLPIGLRFEKTITIIFYNYDVKVLRCHTATAGSKEFGEWNTECRWKKCTAKKYWKLRNHTYYLAWEKERECEW